VRPEVLEFLGNVEFYWYYDWDITLAIELAFENTPTTGTMWATGYSLYVLGYDAMRVDDYNYQSDWSK